MVQALERQGIVRLDGPVTKRWVSLSEGVLSERSKSTLALLDIRQQVILERNDVTMFKSGGESWSG